MNDMNYQKSGRRCAVALLRYFGISLIVFLSGCGESKSIIGVTPTDATKETLVPEKESVDAICGNQKVEPGELCDDGENDRIDGGCLPGCKEMDNSDDLFDQSLVDISITMPPKSWEALRQETKTAVSAFGTAECRTREAFSKQRRNTL